MRLVSDERGQGAQGEDGRADGELREPPDLTLPRLS